MLVHKQYVQVPEKKENEPVHVSGAIGTDVVTIGELGASGGAKGIERGSGVAGDATGIQRPLLPLLRAESSAGMPTGATTLWEFAVPPFATALGDEFVLQSAVVLASSEP